MNQIYNTLNEVKEATKQLNVSSIVPIHIDDNGVMKKINKYVGIYNNSLGEIAAMVKPAYNLIQHKFYFDSVAEALDRLNIKFSMKIQQSGNRAFADIDFKDRNIEFKKLNEEFTTGFRLTNSYDKTTGLSIAPRFTRLACTNGMILTRCENVISVKHHQKILKELEGYISRRINETITNYEDLQNLVSVSMQDSKEWKTCCYIIAQLFKQVKHREEILKRLGISMITTEDKNKKKSINYVWDDIKKKKNKFTRWELYNAITNYITYGEAITPHIENMFHNKAEKLLITKLEKMPYVEMKI